MLKAIIIEDEESGRDLLRFDLQNNCPDVEIAAEADSVESGVTAIRKHRPDLVFLDIRLEPGTGFEILEQVEDQDFDVIFTTAYQEYAIRAIRCSAMDYLMKPIDEDELVAAVKRVEEKKGKEDNRKKFQLLKQNLAGPNAFRQIALPTLEGLLFVELENIIRCEGESSYTSIYMENGKRELSSKNIGEIEHLLDGSGFFKIHKSHIVNLNKVRKYMKGNAGYVVMSSGDSVPVSRTKKESFLAILRSNQINQSS